MNARLTFVHALSPLHAGTGQGSGVIDLPIAREKATGVPFLPGSSLKGTLRDSCTDGRKEKVFGPKTDNADAHAGAAQFTDQRLLLLPLRSLAGTFAWVTSPYLLQRFVRDAASAGVAGLPIPAVADGSCGVVQKYQQQGKDIECRLKVSVGGAQRVVLEDLDLTFSEDSQASAWAKAIGPYVFPNDAEWQRMLGERFCIVPDDVLSFLLNTATEIIARTKLREDAKTVQKGGLWYEEALPTETILYGLVLATPNAKTGLSESEIFDVVRGSIPPSVQLGGMATVGRGLCRLLLQDAQGQPQQPTQHPSQPQTTAPISRPKISRGPAPVTKLGEKGGV